MSTAKVAARISGRSPRQKARLAGLFEVLEAVTATFGQVQIRGQFVVMGNAAATAANLLGHPRLFWLGFALSLLGVGFHIAWALLFYELFKVVNKTVAALALAVILVGTAVQAVTAVLYLAPWLVLTSAPSAAAFSPEQLQALAYIVFRWNGYAFNVYLVFFGAWCFLSGCLIFRSRFMPRLLGVLLSISGLGWMLYLVPPFGMRMFPVIAAASGLGEFPLQLWLLIKGVDNQRWKEQALAARRASAEEIQ
jgi:hypothetical protein